MRLYKARANIALTMSINIDIQQNSGENNLSMLRRFRTRVKSAGIIMHLKKNRFYARSQSPFQQKQGKLNRIEKRKEQERLYKLGKTS